jgi:hypothetical protein
MRWNRRLFATTCFADGPGGAGTALATIAFVEKRRRKSARAHGFSVIEVVVIAALIAIIVGLGFPRLAALMPGYRLSGAARTLGSELRRARFKAIAEGRRYRVAVNAGAKTFTTCHESTNGAGDYDTVVGGSRINCDGIRSIDDAGAITVDAGGAYTAIFDGRGYCDPSLALTLRARNSATTQLSTRRTGKVDVG